MNAVTWALVCEEDLQKSKIIKALFLSYLPRAVGTYLSQQNTQQWEFETQQRGSCIAIL